MKRKITYISPLVPQKFRKYVKEIIRQIEMRAFRGDNVHCIICDSSFRSFSTYGVEKRKNARCLNCNSLERHRLLWKYLNSKTNLFNRKIKMLHFAPQRLFLRLFSKNENIEYTPCDIQPETYEYYGITKITKADVMKIPFDDNSFDVVMCNHVLEHVENDKLAMSELYRVMKKGGWGIFQVPLDYDRESTYEDKNITDSKGREKAFGQYDHLRVFGRDYKDRLASVGFKVIEDDYVNSFSQEEIKRNGFVKGELIYYCNKF